MASLRFLSPVVPGVLILLASVLSVSAQSPNNTATISGTVVAADSGKPMHDVGVVATAGDTRKYTNTDAVGAFMFTDLSPGAYQISSNRAGYLPTNYGQPHPG